MKAILKNGVIHPTEPVPADWTEGTELEVRKSSNGVADLEARFHRLKSQWRADTLVLSDPNKIMGHPATRAIIAMGDAVVPMILRDLRDNLGLAQECDEPRKAAVSHWSTPCALV